MKKSLLFGLLLLLLAACTQTQLAPPEEVHTQAQKESYRFSDHNARASFYSSDDCVFTYVSVFATAQKSKAGNAGGTEPWVDVYLDQYDECTETFIYTYAYGGTSLANGAFKVGGGLKSASLSNTTIQLSGERCIDWWDCSPLTGSLDVNLNWVGTGTLSSTKSTYQFRSPDFRYQSRSKGTFRDAVASGNVSVTLDGLIATFTSSSSARIAKSTSGSIFVADSLALQADRYSFRGQSAYAVFFSSDECSYTRVDVFAAEEKFRSGNVGRTDPWAYGYVDHYDWCTDTGAFGEFRVSLAPGAFQTKGPRSATLKATFEIFDGYWEYDEVTDDLYWVEESVGAVDVDLTWVGSNKTTKEKQSFQSRSSGYKSRYSAQGTFRDAVASGNVTVSLDGLNATFNSSENAWMGTSKSGWVEIYK
jgi:hypothetical protein